MRLFNTIFHLRKINAKLMLNSLKKTILSHFFISLNNIVSNNLSFLPFLLPRWRSYVFVEIFFSRYYCQSTQNSLKHREMWFLVGVRMCVCVCVCARARVRARACVCVRFSTFEYPITHKRLEISIWNLVRQWSNHNPLIVTIFMIIDARFEILWDFDFFEKRTWQI